MDDTLAKIKIDETEFTDYKDLDTSQVELNYPARANGEYTELEEEYHKQTQELWVRHNLNGRRFSTSPKIYTMNQCRMTEKEQSSDIGVAGFDRLVVILPETTERIVIFPNINGDPKSFNSCMRYLHEKKYLEDNNIAIIFYPGIFSSNPSDENNKKILMNFLDVKTNRTTKASLFFLAENTIARRKTACKAQYTRAGQFPVIAMYEPTYIIYPKTINTPDNNTFRGILISGASKNEVSLPQSNVKNIGSPMLYLTQSYDRYKKISKRGGLAFVAFPPNIRRGEDNIDEEYKVFRSSAQENKIVDILLKHDTGISMEGNWDSFKPSNEAYLALDGVNYTQVPLIGNMFSIRNPVDKVVENWKKLRFTYDEASMLNILNFTPRLLSTIFGEEEWKNKLAIFLSDTINSKCFTDIKLITTQECSRASEFLEAVRNFLTQISMESVFSTDDSYIEEIGEGSEDAESSQEKSIEPPKEKCDTDIIYADKEFNNGKYKVINEQKPEYTELLTEDMDTNVWYRHIQINKMPSRIEIPAIPGEAVDAVNVKFNKFIAKIRAKYPNCNFNSGAPVDT